MTAATFQVQTTAGGHGTAFYIGNGEWITNHHVVDTVSSASLVHGGTRLTATVDGSLPGYEVAPRTRAGERWVRWPAVVRQACRWRVPGLRLRHSVRHRGVSKHAPFSVHGSARRRRRGPVGRRDESRQQRRPIVDDCGRDRRRYIRVLRHTVRARGRHRVRHRRRDSDGPTPRPAIRHALTPVRPTPATAAGDHRAAATCRGMERSRSVPSRRRRARDQSKLEWWAIEASRTGQCALQPRSPGVTTACALTSLRRAPRHQIIERRRGGPSGPHSFPPRPATLEITAFCNA